MTHRPANKLSPGRLSFFLACVAWSALLALGAVQGWVYAASADANRLFLPMIFHPDPFASDAPIWLDGSTPPMPEVGLFRNSFHLLQPAQSSELHIFADTRYEVWLDGKWVGRGPARFLVDQREYDIFPLGTLVPGEHLVAVLVQWAPNNRRSESVAPLLIAHAQGDLGAGMTLLTSTTSSSQWKCLRADAWRSDAWPVDTRGLIGPTELLDLRRLPGDWNQPGFVDEAWAPAVVRSLDARTAFLRLVARVDPIHQPVIKSDAIPLESGSRSNSLGEFAYAPRSIDLLVNVPILTTLFDAGLLSPGYVLGELSATESGSFDLKFLALEPADLNLELLAAAAPPVGFMKVDDRKLAWQAAGVERPDVLLASIPLVPGAHTLSFKGVPAQGVTFSLSRSGMAYAEIPFEQGSHAGRRLLLAKTVSNPSQVSLSLTSQGLGLEFATLPSYVVLDLGRAVHGRLLVQVSAPAGSILDIGWDERLWTSARRPLPYPGSLYPQWNQVDSWILDGAPRWLSTIDARSGRYIMIAAWGPGPVRITDIRVLEERYPLTQVGSFHSSDPLLDLIWQVGVDTLTPNMTDSYTDTPWRERGFWLGDAWVEYQVNRVAFGDTGLIRRGLRQAATLIAKDVAPGLVPNNNGLHMLDYSMLWVHTLADYLHDTQDDDLSVEMLAPVRRLMSHLASHENPLTGLLDLPQDGWGTTGYIDSRGYYSRYGQSAAFNALYYATFLRAAEVAERAGDVESAAGWRARSVTLKEQINQALYSGEQDRYATHIYAGEVYSPTLHAQAWPLAYGVTPEGKSAMVAEALLEMISPDPAAPNVGTYGMAWVLEGLGEAGYVPQALDIIRKYYGHMLDAGASTWWESFDADAYPQNSFSHGWAASPTWFLTTYVLGARLTRLDSWLVKPAFDSIDYASGDLPLHDGVLSVAWERSSCPDGQPGEIRLSLAAPQSTHGEVIFPDLGPGLTITLDHQAVWQDGVALVSDAFAEAGNIHLPLGGGSHQIEASQACIP